VEDARTFTWQRSVGRMEEILQEQVEKRTTAPGEPAAV
jgi:hypothetical protein